MGSFGLNLLLRLYLWNRRFGFYIRGCVISRFWPRITNFTNVLIYENKYFIHPSFNKMTHPMCKGRHFATKNDLLSGSLEVGILIGRFFTSLLPQPNPNPSIKLPTLRRSPSERGIKIFPKWVLIA